MRGGKLRSLRRAGQKFEKTRMYAFFKKILKAQLHATCACSKCTRIDLSLITRNVWFVCVACPNRGALRRRRPRDGDTMALRQNIFQVIGYFYAHSRLLGGGGRFSSIGVTNCFFQDRACIFECHNMFCVFSLKIVFLSCEPR